MEKKIIGYRCNVDYENQFTKGKIYKLRPGKNLWNNEAFIDDRGRPNGWSIYNDDRFEPVYDGDRKTVKDIINSIYGLVLNKNIGTNINPELTQYLNSINNKMENKKIYYLKQEVKLNQVIDFNGLKIKVTQDLINNNPNLFHVEEEKKVIGIDMLCIKPIHTYIKGNVYNSNGCWINWGTNFVKIDGIKYLKHNSGFIHKYYINIDSNGNYKYYDTFGNECDKPNEIQFELASTEEEYDLQEELQQLLDEAQKRYPVGTKLSKYHTVTLHPDKKTYLVYSNKSVEVHVGDGTYFQVKGGDEWFQVHKEPVKDLKYYENFYIDNSYYLFMKRVHPNLYYQLILQTIADDLNGDWKADWSYGETTKHCIQIHENKIEVEYYYTAKHPNTYFKSKELAQQAIDIMGEDKLKLIFNIE